MPRIFKHLEAVCLQVNLMSTSAQINQLKDTILYYTMAIVREGQRPYITHSQRVTYLCKRVLNEPKV